MTAPDGPHLAFPFRIGGDGRTVCVRSLDEHVKGEILQLILTNLGERAFLPDFGGNARRLVFEGADETTTGMAKSMLSQALSRWLGTRVKVDSLTVEAIDNTLGVDLSYHVVGSDQINRLQFRRTGV
jgi:Bacteriophage baseplate protein W